MAKNNISYDLNKNCQEYINTSQGLIHITEDKLENILLKNRDCLTAKRAWITPLSILLTCITSLLTTTFNDWLLPAAVWHAMFILIGASSFVWLIISSIKAIKNRKSGDINTLMQKIKTNM